jgi:hypothetical protein
VCSQILQYAPHIGGHRHPRNRNSTRTSTISLISRPKSKEGELTRTAEILQHCLSRDLLRHRLSPCVCLHSIRGQPWSRIVVLFSWSEVPVLKSFDHSQGRNLFPTSFSNDEVSSQNWHAVTKVAAKKQPRCGFGLVGGVIVPYKISIPVN